METKTFKTQEEATDFITSISDKDVTIDGYETDDGMFCVAWIENKKYIAFDGKEYTDQVWTKEDGTMIVVQDLDPEHAKNIIRMIIRKQDESYAEILESTASLTAALEALQISVNDDIPDPEEPRVLH